MTFMVSIDTATIRKRCLVWCKSHVEAVVSADIAAPSRTGLMATPRLSPDPCAAERSDERVVQAQTTAVAGSDRVWPHMRGAFREGVQAAFTVLGRMPPTPVPARVDLPGAILPAAVLCAAIMIAANLRGTDLSGAWLDGVVLGDARLRGTNLRRAWLAGAVLTGHVCSVPTSPARASPRPISLAPW